MGESNSYVQAARAGRGSAAAASGRPRRHESADLLQIVLQRRKRLLRALKISGA